jgi:hypothetical protein
VFVEAVKKNQIGVAPQEALFVSTPPGTIPATVRPPRIPELANAPVVAGVAPASNASGEVSPPEMAIAETSKPAAQPAAKSNIGSLFGSLFSSKTAEAKAPETKPAEKTASPIDRVARLVGLGGKDKDTKAAEVAPPAPKPKPVAKPTSIASNGAIRAKQAEAEPIKTTEAQAPASSGAITPARAPAPPSTAMNGAAPVVPTGNFDNRWQGFR